MESIKVLIVEDSPATRDYLTELVTIIGYQAHAVKAKNEFVEAFHRYVPDILLLGSSHHAGHVRAFAEVVGRERSGTPILFIGDGSITLGDQGFPETARISSIPVHFDTADLKEAIAELVGGIQELDYTKLDSIIVGQAPAMVKIKHNVVRLSKSDVTVLISGESGTGKELVARAIHRLSPRATRPFVKVNCAALPDNLLESELFGFEKGAFTGAYQKKAGKFALAHSGTLLLDEISELPLTMQAKLLQVLQDDEVSSLGSLVNTRFDTRILAATNSNLTEMVRQGQFRADLYFRINVVSIHMPPLREQQQDIDLLCEHFLKEYGRRHGRGSMAINKENMNWLHQHYWPGNVRELQNFIQGITILGHEETVYENMRKNVAARAVLNGPRPLPPPQAGGNDGRMSPATRSLKSVCKAAVRKAETEAIVDALFYTQWNRKKAAALLNISYKALLNKVKEYSLAKESREIHQKV
jgi:DNA-binding NtrC family response regulator